MDRMFQQSVKDFGVVPLHGGFFDRIRGKIFRAMSGGTWFVSSA
jgi:hypothetical protein